MASDVSLNIEVLGEGSVFLRVQPASEAAKKLVKSDVVTLLGYEWQFFVYRAEDQEHIQLTICCPEYYDEMMHSVDHRRVIKADIDVHSVEQEPQPAHLLLHPPGACPAICHHLVVDMAPQFGFKQRSTGATCVLMPASLMLNLKDDVLDLVCDIDLVNPVPAALAPLCSPDAPAPDFTLTCTDGKTVQVHRLLLQLASPVFAGLLSHLPDSRALQLRESSFEALLLLAFVYPAQPKPSLTLRQAQLLCKVADKYDVTGAVAPHVAAIFRGDYQFTSDCESLAYVMTWLELADRLGMADLLEQCIEHLVCKARELAYGPKADVAVLERLSSSTLAKLLLRGSPCNCD